MKSILDTFHICPPRPIPDTRCSRRVCRIDGVLVRRVAISESGRGCKRLAEELGVVTLLSIVFSQEAQREVDTDVDTDVLAVDRAISEQRKIDEDDRWIRFSVANADDER